MDVTVIEIDGDLMAVDEAIRDAVAQLRAGEGQILIHTVSDPAGEAEGRFSGEPMRRNRALLEAAGVPAAELDVLEQAGATER